MDELIGESYDPFSQGGQAYIGSMDLEVGFARENRTTDTPYDQDELAAVFTRTFNGQIFAPGQRLLLDVKNTPLSVLVRTVTLVDLSMEKGGETPVQSDPRARGILTGQSNIGFYKDARSPIKLKGSSKRPAANAISTSLDSRKHCLSCPLMNVLGSITTRATDKVSSLA